MSLMKTILLAIALLTTLPIECLAKADSAKTKRVLILYSHQTVLPVNLLWDRGTREGLQNLGQPVAFDVEYLEFDRLQRREQRDLWAEQLRLKYKENPPDIVIPVNDAAAECVVNTYPDLFPQASILLFSVSQQMISRLGPNTRMTGAANQPDYLATLETARRLFPETRSVIVVSRIGEVELENIKAVQAELENSELAEQLKIAYWIGLPAASLCERASRLEAGTVILYLTQLRNQDGTLSINSVDVACKLGQSAAVPVFGLDTLVGTAVLGGCLGKTELSAQRAGAIAVNLTDRELPSHSSDSATRMDRSDSAWRQLRRSEIRDLNLPPGTVIAFRVPTLWERNRATIMAGLAAICLQAITILGLLVSRSKRLRVEKSLVESRNEAKRLTGRVLANQEEELKTLARELHDDFSQRLAANAISIGGIEQPLIPADPVRRELATIRERLVDLSKDMHRVSRQLHPSILEELGLADAIRSECHYWEELSTTKFSVSCGKLPSGMSDDVALCLFRVAQEAIRNAAKYADANLVELDLSADSEMIHLQVQDDGCGFDVALTPYQPGLGLASMRERVFFAGGRIRIESAEGKGTVICVKIPRSEP